MSATPFNVIVMATSWLLSPKTIQLIAMVADAAAGLEYLQSINFVHSDLAARSCVVTQSLSVKISGKEDLECKTVEHTSTLLPPKYTT